MFLISSYSSSFLLIFSCFVLVILADIEVVIPPSSFSNYATFNSYWNHFYPWGNHHNGKALMVDENIYLENSGLTLKATRNVTESDDLEFNYLSGAVYAKKLISVTEKYPNYVICGDFLAPMIPGAWPAFWLTCETWPPEVDILEFKGDNNNNFNVYIDHDKPTYWDRIPITSPNDWNTYCISMKKVNKRDVKITFSLNNVQNKTHTAVGYVGKRFWLIINLQMEGSSGKTGPHNDTFYQARNVFVIREKAS